MAKEITYVKSDIVAPTSGTSVAAVVDLGLAIGEAARILGVLIVAEIAAIFVAGSLGIIDAVYSFDPEDTAVVPTDDEQFAFCGAAIGAIAASTGATKQSEVLFHDFSGMNVITTRNIALIAKATGMDCIVYGKVYYEKYRPAATELVQLIATRR